MTGPARRNPARGRRVAERAAELIRADGWAQGWQGGPDVGWCAAGALAAAADETAPGAEGAALTDALELVAEALADRPGRDAAALGPPAWNDHPDRTCADVLQALDTAADLIVVRATTGARARP